MATKPPRADVSLTETEHNPPSEALLSDVWERHKVYSDNASNAQERFFLIRRILAYLSVAIVVLAVAQPSMKQAYEDLIASDITDDLPWYMAGFFVQGWSTGGGAVDPLVIQIVNFLLILLPIIVTGMLAFAVKFDRGNSWVMLRGNSEALKTEIFLYRTRVKEYRRNRNAVLVEKVKQISERVKSTSVHEAALHPYEWEPIPQFRRGWVFRVAHWAVMKLSQGISQAWNFLFEFKKVPAGTRLPASRSQAVVGLSREEYEYQKRYADLDAARYLHFRLESQFDWYRNKCKKYDRQNQLLQTSIYFFAGLGTLFAAINQQYLIPISAAVSTALVNYLEYRRVEATLIGYNQAADALYDIHVWWYSLSETAKSKRANFEKLVLNTEETIRIEHGSWLQDMQERLSSLYGEEENTSATPTEADEGEPIDGTENPAAVHPLAPAKEPT